MILFVTDKVLGIKIRQTAPYYSLIVDTNLLIELF